MSKNIYDVFAGTNWPLLRDEKLFLMQLPRLYPLSDEEMQKVDGIVHWIDAIQDAAVDEGVADPAEVYGTEEES